MAGEKKYTRIPPESTGDRVYMIHTAEINYDGKDPTHVWQVGAMYTVTGNGGDTFTFHLHGVYEPTSTTGRLSVHYSEAAKEEGYVASNDQSIQIDTDNDDILETVATVNTDAYDIYIPAQNIMGHDNPEYGLNVDRFGAADVTFTDGAPEITAFGKLRVNEPRTLAIYDFTHGKMPDQFVNSREGVGVDVVWKEGDGTVELSTTAAQGDRVTHTSNLFHACNNGTGVLYIFGARLGDTGATNVVRNWGAFDATDGFFFQMNGTDLRVAHRASLNDGTTDTMVVSQDDWNLDTLLGTGGGTNPSGMNLDVSKSNIYWIDYQHLAGGRVRYGVYYEGARIACHELVMENGEGMLADVANANALRIPHRPICWAQASPGGSPGAPAFMYALGAGVYLESDTDPLSIAQQYSLDYSRKVFSKPHTVGYTKTRQTNGRSPGTTSVAAISSISGDGSTVTVDTATDHGLSTGDRVVIYGTVNHDGLRLPITVTDANTFTYSDSTTNAEVIGNVGEPGAVTTSGHSGQTSTQYIFTASPRQFYLNSDGTVSDRENHSVYQPLIFDQYANEIATSSGRPLEVRVFSKCLLRGVRWRNGGTQAPTLQYDTQGDHLAHGPEILRYVINGSGKYEFVSSSDAYQYNTVRNLSDQPFSRILQPLSSIDTGNDKYGTGVSKVKVTVKNNPLYGSSLHYFEDKQPVLLTNLNGAQSFDSIFGANSIKASGDPGGYASAERITYANGSPSSADWYFLSLIDRDEGWLYDTQLNIDDDRTIRIVSMDAVGGTQVGDSFAVTSGAASGATATVLAIEGLDLWICGRSSTALDVGVTSGAVDTLSGGTSVGNITGITKNTIDPDSDTLLDYWTSLNALSETDLALTTTGVFNDPDLALFGTNPPRQAWTFMTRNVTDDDPTNDADGDVGPTLNGNAELRTTLIWKERNL